MAIGSVMRDRWRAATISQIEYAGVRPKPATPVMRAMTTPTAKFEMDETH